MKSYYLSAFMAASIPSAATPLACKRASNCAAGLTAWSDANFAGKSHQYNVSWDTCSTFEPPSHVSNEVYQNTNVYSYCPVSMAAQFPFDQPAGVSSLAANEGNWCTVYPYVHMLPFSCLARRKPSSRVLIVKLQERRLQSRTRKRQRHAQRGWELL